MPPQIRSRVEYLIHTDKILIVVVYYATWAACRIKLYTNIKTIKQKKTETKTKNDLK